MIGRERALEIVRAHVKRENLVKHILAVETIMRGISAELDEDVELWGMTGLLHDVDFDETYETPARHGIRSIEILNSEVPGEVPEEILKAIRAHNPEHTGVQPETKMEYALLAADAISGLVIATALILPSKRLAEVDAKDIARRFKEKDFARRCNRENMLYAEKAGISMEKFFEIATESLKGIASELGL
ncbi:MAG: HD domain-containing protein [Candidatus Aenigmatarchaeota archaeon]